MFSCFKFIMKSVSMSNILWLFVLSIHGIPWQFELSCFGGRSFYELITFLISSFLFLTQLTGLDSNEAQLNDMEQQRSVEDLFIRSTDSNSSTSTDECRNRRPQTTVVGDGKSCLICGHVSHGFHFGILACRACAAFFRRTVVENKIYKCRQKCQCIIRKGQVLYESIR